MTHCQTYVNYQLLYFVSLCSSVFFNTKPSIWWFLSIKLLLVIFSASKRSSQILGRLFSSLLGFCSDICMCNLIGFETCYVHKVSLQSAWHHHFLPLRLLPQCPQEDRGSSAFHLPTVGVFCTFFFPLFSLCVCLYLTQITNSLKTEICSKPRTYLSLK